MTHKNIQKIFMPPKIFIFSENPKNIEIQNFEPKKITRAYIRMKISKYPPCWVQDPRVLFFANWPQTARRLDLLDIVRTETSQFQVVQLSQNNITWSAVD